LRLVQRALAAVLNARVGHLGRGHGIAARGLLLVGLDVIGQCVTEINVTSPTCFQEIHQQTGCDVAALFVQALEQAVGG